MQPFTTSIEHLSLSVTWAINFERCSSKVLVSFTWEPRLGLKCQVGPTCGGQPPATLPVVMDSLVQLWDYPAASKATVTNLRHQGHTTFSFESFVRACRTRIAAVALSPFVLN